VHNLEYYETHNLFKHDNNNSMFHLDVKILGAVDNANMHSFKTFWEH